MKVAGEKGPVFKTSRISYFNNYILAALSVVLFTMLLPYVNIEFSFIPSTFHQLWSSLALLFFLLFVAYLLEEPSIERIMRKYIVTNNEVIKVEGILRKSRIGIPHQSVADVKVRKGILGRIFDFGDIDVVGTKNKIRMKGIKEPEIVYRIIQNKISLLRGSGTKKKTKVEPPKTKEKKPKK